MIVQLPLLYYVCYKKQSIFIFNNLLTMLTQYIIMLRGVNYDTTSSIILIYPSYWHHLR